VADLSGLGNAARYVAFGTELAVSVIAGLMGGYYLDEYLGTSPLFLLLLTVGGSIGALYRLLWNLKKITSARRHGS